MKPLGPRVTLPELRSRRDTTQRRVAALAGTKQPNISKIEARADHQVSTLVAYVRALGGELRIVADFDTERFEIDLPATAPRPKESYRVIWQNPDTRSLLRVGRLDYDGRTYRYKYDLDGESQFRPFPAFPDPSIVYESDVLWSVFASGAASTTAVGVSLLLGGSSPVPITVEISASKETRDGILQLVPISTSSPDGSTSLDFLASGVRHAITDNPQAEERLSALHPGDPLDLRRDFGFERSRSHARRLLSAGVPIGWFPDHAIDEIDDLERRGFTLTVEVLRVGGPATNPHLRLMCRLRGTPPGGRHQ